MHTTNKNQGVYYQEKPGKPGFLFNLKNQGIPMEFY